MGKDSLEAVYLNLVEKIQLDLSELEMYCSDYFVKEKLHKILDYIDKETTDDKDVLEMLIKERIKETKGVNSEMNTNFYFLYRNLLEGKINMQDAQAMYEMYIKELKTS